MELNETPHRKQRGIFLSNISYLSDFIYLRCFMYAINILSLSYYRNFFYVEPLQGSMILLLPPTASGVIHIKPLRGFMLIPCLNADLQDFYKISFLVSQAGITPCRILRVESSIYDLSYTKELRAHA